MLSLDVSYGPQIGPLGLIICSIIALVVFALLVGLLIRRSLRKDAGRPRPDNGEIVDPLGPTLPRQAPPPPLGTTQSYNLPGPAPRPQPEDVPREPRP